jgi:hypothetical protein
VITYAACDDLADYLCDFVGFSPCVLMFSPPLLDVWWLQLT